MKYKIELTCWDFGNPNPYRDEIDQIFDDEKDAKIALLMAAIDEAESLNDPYDDGGDYRHDRRHFAIDLEGGDHFDAVIRCWDGLADYMNVTGYKIMEVKE